LPQGKSLTGVIEFLLNEVADAGFSVKGLDRQFYTVDVINIFRIRRYRLSSLAH